MIRYVDVANQGGGDNEAGTWLTEAVSVNATGGMMGRTALHAACSSGHMDVVQLLCKVSTSNLMVAHGQSAHDF